MRIYRISYRLRGVILALMFLTIAFSTLAQTGGNDCGQLNRAECQQVDASLSLTRDLNAAAFDAEIVLTIRDVYTRAFSTLRVFLDGAYRLNDDRNSSDPVIAVRGLDADVSVVVDLSELDPTGGLYNDLPAEEYAFDLSLLDGIGYINLSKLVGDDVREADWYGIDLGALIQLSLNSLGDLGSADLLPPVNNNSANSAPALPFELEPTDVQRLSDVTVNDVAMERYLWIVDFGTLLDDTFSRMTFNASMLTILDAYLQGQNYSDAELREIIDNYAQVLDVMSLRVERVINPVDSTIHRVTYSFAYQPTDSLLDTLYYGLDPLGLGSTASDIYLDVTINRTQFDGDFALTAPENAILLTLFDLLPLLEDANL
ncbi:MAG: hypothetical protein RLP44_09045 [Aggregatilineales bacterium]